LVAEAVRLDREIAAHQDQLKALKARLINEARVRLEDSSENVIVFQGAEGDVARVNLPARTLKPRLEADGKAFEKVRAITGTSFGNLFQSVISYLSVEGFRHEAALLLGPAAPRLIKLCETEGRPRVSFETKGSC